ncbi:hypothetical protein [Stenotrophomonas sp. 24(2023)]|uniref:hypothetical protein n=1 Tax=Stenotrophomonas sp. 24(2023) TaxID=3068324 RepID=UPI0027DF7010|nr:hypothetical protein [Stenotrophomonas sp. 24(2023)]WMJ67668.1 hypothetical protein Q9R17_10555 [Stenotrophomonas sp. 24(2023)]
MRPLLLASLAVLAIAGCDRPGTGSTSTSITHVRANGVDTVHSKVTVTGGIARFDCIASRSGRCHYLVLDPRCSVDAACDQPPLRRLEVEAGKTTEVTGLPKGFQQCVSDVQKEHCHRE